MSESRARALRRLMLLTVGIAVVLAVVAVLLFLDEDYRAYAAVVLGVALAHGASAGFTLRALPARGEAARRGSIVTGALLLLLSLPLIGIFLGLITAVAGIGVLFVTLSREPEPA